MDQSAVGQAMEFIGYPAAAVCQKYVEFVIWLVFACDDQFVRLGKRPVVFGVVSLSVSTCPAGSTRQQQQYNSTVVLLEA